MTGDSIYGNDGKLRGWLKAQRLAHVLGVSGNHYVWIDWQQQPVAVVAQRMPRQAWQRLSAGSGSKGPRWFDWAAIVFMIGVPIASFADKNPNPKVLPPGSHPFGASYVDWSIRWWQCAVGLPANDHPLTDTADCSEGQSGHVWFLGGKFCPTPALGCSFMVERTCNVRITIFR